MLDYMGDWLYDVPIITVWGVGESAFVMMVFCVPAAPQVFKTKGVGLGSKLARSLPWAPASRRKSRNLKGGSSSKSTAPASNSYQKMDEEGSQVALTELGGPHHHHHGAHPAPVGRGGGGGGDPGVGGRIVKTTELVTREEEAAAGGSHGAFYHREQGRGQLHPWA